MCERAHAYYRAFLYIFEVCGVCYFGRILGCFLTKKSGKVVEMWKAGHTGAALRLRRDYVQQSSSTTNHVIVTKEDTHETPKSNTKRNTSCTTAHYWYALCNHATFRRQQFRIASRPTDSNFDHCFQRPSSSA